MICFFFFQAEDGIRDYKVTGVQTCALPIYPHARPAPCGATVRAVDDYRRPRLRARTPAGGRHRGLHGDGGRLRGTGSGDPVIALNVVPRFQLSLGLRTGGSIIGAREAALLQGIERTKSIKEGAKLAGVGYRTAWGAGRTMQRALGRPVVQSRTGGPGGGASVLTEDARELLRFYQDLHRQLDERDRKSTRLNSSHLVISYAVFCLKKQ